MGLDERIKLIEKIEEERNSRVIAYITGDRFGIPPAQIGEDFSPLSFLMEKKFQPTILQEKIAFLESKDSSYIFNVKLLLEPIRQNPPQLLLNINYQLPQDLLQIIQQNPDLNQIIRVILERLQPYIPILIQEELEKQMPIIDLKVRLIEGNWKKSEIIIDHSCKTLMLEVGGLNGISICFKFMGPRVVVGDAIVGPIVVTGGGIYGLLNGSTFIGRIVVVVGGIYGLLNGSGEAVFGFRVSGNLNSYLNTFQGRILMLILVSGLILSLIVSWVNDLKNFSNYTSINTLVYINKAVVIK